MRHQHTVVRSMEYQDADPDLSFDGHSSAETWFPFRRSGWKGQITRPSTFTPHQVSPAKPQTSHVKRNIENHEHRGL